MKRCGFGRASGPGGGGVAGPGRPVSSATTGVPASGRGQGLQLRVDLREEGDPITDWAFEQQAEATIFLNDHWQVVGLSLVAVVVAAAGYVFFRSGSSEDTPPAAEGAPTEPAPASGADPATETQPPIDTVEPIDEETASTTT